MTDLATIVKSVALAALVVLLAWRCLLRRRRYHQELAREAQATAKAWQGRGLNGKLLRQRLRRVRTDYLSAIRARATSGWSKEQLLRAAQRTIRRFAYFRGRSPVASELPVDGSVKSAGGDLG